MRRLLCVLLVLVCVAGVRADDKAQEILDRAIKNHGGKEKLGSRPALQWKARGTMIMGESKTPYTISYALQPTDKFRFDMSFDLMGNKAELTVVVNGNQAWEKGFGQIREMPKEKFQEVRHMVHVISVSQLLPLKDKTYTLKATGETKVEGKPADGIKVSAAGHRDVTLYFDRESGLLVKSETRVVDEFSNKEVTQEAYSQGYHEKDGLKLFRKLVIKRDGKPFIEEEMSDQKFVEKLDPKTFAKP